MSPPGPSRLAGGVLGALAAGAAVGVAVERHAVGRRRLAPDPLAREPLDRMLGRWRSVEAADGLPLAVLESAPFAAAGPGRPTLLFVHGYAVDSRCWHFQWRDLARAPHGYRLVCYDQRGHGRSGAPDAPTSVEQLAGDLAAVLAAAVPTGPVALVGHSMGAMTVAALAGAQPELFGPRVVAVALASTAAERLAETTFGLPPAVGGLTRRVLPPAVRLLAARAALVDHGRRLTGDLAYLATARLAFGTPVPPSLVDLVDRMVAATRFEVIAGLYPSLAALDQRTVLATLGRVPTLVLAGAADRITPLDRVRAVAAAVPGAELVVVPRAGHMVMLERPALVTGTLGDWLADVPAARPGRVRADPAGGR